MRPVWEIDGEDVEKLQGDSPSFVRFLNALLSVHAYEGRLPDSAVSLNQKDMEGDGGVDAVISQAILASLDPTGRFERSNLLAVQGKSDGEHQGQGPEGGRGRPRKLLSIRRSINPTHAGWSSRATVTASASPTTCPIRRRSNGRAGSWPPPERLIPTPRALRPHRL